MNLLVTQYEFATGRWGCRLAATTRGKVQRARGWLLPSLNLREGAVLVRGLASARAASAILCHAFESGAGCAGRPPLFLMSLEAECDGVLGSNGVCRVWIDDGDD